MRDYGRIVTKINQSLWLITPEGLNTILMIVSERMQDGRLSEEELETRLASFGGRRSSNDDKAYNVINGVGILPIQGPIFGKANLMTEFSGATSMEAFQQDFRAMMKDDAVDSIIMDFDTPGGTSDLIEEVGQEIYDARGKKPIYSCVNTTCGSAGLWLATQADKVFSTPSGMVGSLGAYTVHQDQSVSDAQNGVKFTFISAGKYKTEGNPHEPLSHEAIQHRQEQVNEVMGSFVGAVARGRGADDEYVSANYGEGRMLTPKQALEVGMIDGIQSYDDILSSATVDRPKAVSLVVGDNAPIAAQMVGDVVFMTGADGSLNVTAVNQLIKASLIERTELGNPVITLPDADDDKSSIRREDDTMKLSVEALTALGLSADATDEQISTAILAQAASAKSLEELKASIEGRKKFAEMFPEEHARMTTQDEYIKNLEAKNFADAYAGIRFADIKVTVGEDGEENKVVEPTTKGLSGLALDKIKTSSTKINDGTFQLSDFKETLDSIMMGGIVDYGVKGSDVGKEPEDTEEVKITGNTLENRTAFANKVAEIEKKDNVDQDTAIRIVAEKHPELWAAWKSPTISVS